MTMRRWYPWAPLPPARFRGSAAVARRPVFQAQHQPRHASAALHVVNQDFVDIGRRLAAVPDTFGIDHHGRPEFAAVETTGLIDADIMEAELLRARLHIIAQLLRALLLAAAARMPGRTLVHAEEDMDAIVGRGIVLTAIWRLAHDALPFGPPAANCSQKARCICSTVCAPLDSQVCISFSASIPASVFVMRSRSSLIISACSGATSGRPRKARASSGVQSMSIVIFMVNPWACPIMAVRDWNRHCASFETAAARPPQDEEYFFAPSTIHLILRSALRARLEGRTLVMQANRRTIPDASGRRVLYMCRHRPMLPCFYRNMPPAATPRPSSADSRRHAQQPRSRDQPLPAAAQGQPGALAALGPG